MANDDNWKNTSYCHMVGMVCLEVNDLRNPREMAFGEDCARPGEVKPGK